MIGVEIAEELNRVARYNIDHNRDRLVCGDVELVTEDAVSYQVPDDVTVAYFYHPFEGRTFARVIDNLVRVLGPKPAPAPDHLCVPDERRLRSGETDRFELERKMKAPRPALRQWHDVLIFRSKARAAR